MSSFTLSNLQLIGVIWLLAAVLLLPFTLAGSVDRKTQPVKYWLTRWLVAVILPVASIAVVAIGLAILAVALSPVLLVVLG